MKKNTVTRLSTSINSLHSSFDPCPRYRLRSAEPATRTGSRSSPSLFVVKPLTPRMQWARSPRWLWQNRIVIHVLIIAAVLISLGFGVRDTQRNVVSHNAHQPAVTLSNHRKQLVSGFTNFLSSHKNTEHLQIYVLLQFFFSKDQGKLDFQGWYTKICV